MRKSEDGLAAIVQQVFELKPDEPSLFAFCNRQRNRVKILERPERGFWLHYFRLEQGRLPLPQVGEEVNPLDVIWQDLRQLLEGSPLKPASQRAVNLPKYVIKHPFSPS